MSSLGRLGLLLFSRPVFALLVLLNIWIFIVVSPGSLVDKLNVPLRIVTFYSLAIGLLSRGKVMQAFIDDMTDPNFYKFIRGNAMFLAWLFALLGLWVNPRKLFETEAGVLRRIALGLLLFPVSIAVAFLFLLYVLAHVIVVMPLSYIAYAVASIPIKGIQRTADDTLFGVTEGTDHQEESLKSSVNENLPFFRSFFVALLSLSLQAILPFALGFVSWLRNFFGFCC